MLGSGCPAVRDVVGLGSTPVDRQVSCPLYRPSRQVAAVEATRLRGRDMASRNDLCGMRATTHHAGIRKTREKRARR